jgi:hypothetical protein
MDWIRFDNFNAVKKPRSRDYVYEVLDGRKISVEQWLDQKRLIDAEYVAAEGMLGYYAGAGGDD